MIGRQIAEQLDGVAGDLDAHAVERLVELDVLQDAAEIGIGGERLARRARSRPACRRADSRRPSLRCCRCRARRTRRGPPGPRSSSRGVQRLAHFFDAFDDGRMRAPDRWRRAGPDRRCPATGARHRAACSIAREQFVRPCRRRPRHSRPSRCGDRSRDCRRCGLR